MGPTLSAVPALSTITGTAWRGALLGFVYCLGLGIPFVLVAMGVNWRTGAIAFVKARMPAFNLAGGSLLILVGVLMVSRTFITPVQQSPSPGKRPAGQRLSGYIPRPRPSNASPAADDTTGAGLNTMNVMKNNCKEPAAWTEQRPI
jgi:hypothetical protein